jgi:hypothetical protein
MARRTYTYNLYAQFLKNNLCVCFSLTTDCVYIFFLKRRVVRITCAEKKIDEGRKEKKEGSAPRERTRSPVRQIDFSFVVCCIKTRVIVSLDISPCSCRPTRKPKRLNPLQSAKDYISRCVHGTYTTSRQRTRWSNSIKWRRQCRTKLGSWHNQQ